MGVPDTRENNNVATEVLTNYEKMMRSVLGLTRLGPGLDECSSATAQGDGNGDHVTFDWSHLTQMSKYGTGT